MIKASDQIRSLFDVLDTCPKQGPSLCFTDMQSGPNASLPGISHSLVWDAFFVDDTKENS